VSRGLSRATAYRAYGIAWSSSRRLTETDSGYAKAPRTESSQAWRTTRRRAWARATSTSFKPGKSGNPGGAHILDDDYDVVDAFDGRTVMAAVRPRP